MINEQLPPGIQGAACNRLFCQMKLIGLPQMNGVATGFKMRFRADYPEEAPDNAVKIYPAPRIATSVSLS